MMRRVFNAVAGLLVLALAGCQTASGPGYFPPVSGNPPPVFFPPDPVQGGGAMPGGSWRQSCERPFLRGGFLWADCPNQRGTFQRARIALGSCPGNRVANVNGNLVCERSGGGVANPGARPVGSHAQSCRRGEIRGEVFSADCLDNRGRHVRSSIRFRQCPGYRVANANGQLVCERGGGGGGGVVVPGGRPVGSHAQTCRRGGIRGDIFTADCLNNRGQYVRSSIRFTECRGLRVANNNGRLVCER